MFTMQAACLVGGALKQYNKYIWSRLATEGKLLISRSLINNYLYRNNYKKWLHFFVVRALN